jgi:hypothetical protein
MEQLFILATAKVDVVHSIFFTDAKSEAGNYLFAI